MSDTHPRPPEQTLEWQSRSLPDADRTWEPSATDAADKAELHFERLSRELNRFEILGELGRGGMGVVYKARQRGLNRLVALKMILAGAHAGLAAIERFRLEAAAVARLKHPGIVQVYEIGEFEERPFFAPEYIEGGTLAQRLAKSPLTFRESAQVTRQLALAMDYAHAQGVVHRDLKPANVLLQTQEDAFGESTESSFDGSSNSSFTHKITDFDLAKQIDSEGDGQTQSGE